MDFLQKHFKKLSCPYAPLDEVLRYSVLIHRALAVVSWEMHNESPPLSIDNPRCLLPWMLICIIYKFREQDLKTEYSCNGINNSVTNDRMLYG